MTLTRSLIAVSLASLAGACATNPEDPCYRDPDSCIDSGGEHHRYVVSSVTLPESAIEARTVGLDLDGDGEVDNQLGGLLQGIGNLTGLELNSVLSEAITSGQITLLVDVQTPSFSSASGAGARLLVGTNPSVAPCESDTDAVCGRHLTPGTRFDVDSSRFIRAAVAGEVSGGQFAGGPSHISLEIDLSDSLGIPAFTIDGIGVGARLSESGDGISGIVAGAVTSKSVSEVVIPAIIDLAHSSCVADNNACCAPGTVGATMMSLFDSDGSCSLTVAELERDQTIGSLLEPRLDLLNGSSQFDPTIGGDPESLSLGARFEAVSAEF
jgi:hypothetical protein